MKTVKPNPHGSNAIRGAISRTNLLPPVYSNRSSEAPILTANWSNNWADWDHSASHNDWDNANPNPPGGK